MLLFTDGDSSSPAEELSAEAVGDSFSLFTRLEGLSNVPSCSMCANFL